jgi:hypothetical protein
MIQSLVLIDNQDLLSPGAVQNALAGIQIGLDQHFAPSPGGCRASLRYTNNLRDLQADEWPFYLVNTVQDAPPGALAWHTDDSYGIYGIVPVQVNLDAKADPFTSLDHEIKETLGDPNASTTMVTRINNRLAWVARENCDPVENDFYQVTPEGGQPVNLSNFVFFPSWAMTAVIPGTRLDFLGKLTQPLTITEGGYFSYYQRGHWLDYPQARTDRHELSRWARRRKRHEFLK